MNETSTKKQITFPSSDVVAIQLSGPHDRCIIFNFNNDGNCHNTQTTFDSFLEDNTAAIKSAESDHMLWLD
jgi:hypothetical protein